MIVLGVFIAGAIAGGGLAAWFCDRLVMSRQLSASAASGVGNKVAVLRAVRAGDTSGAVLVLESALDGDLVILGLLPDSVIDPPTGRILSRAATYREKHPYKSGDTEVDMAISDLLQKYKTAGAEQPR